MFKKRMALFYDDKDTNWPPRSVAKHWEAAEMYQAFLEGDEETLRQLAIQRGTGGSYTQPYFINAMPKLMARVFSDFLFGEPAKFVSDTDQQRLDEIIRANRLHNKLRAAAATTVAQGGVFIKAYVNPNTSRGRQSPLLNILPTTRVLPVFKNQDELVEATVIHTYKGKKSSDVFRHLERHTAGLIENELWQGTSSAKGKQVALSSIPETAELPEQQATGIDRLLVVYIPGHQETDAAEGQSLYSGLEDYFFSLNELATILGNSARVSEPRVFVDQSLLDQRNSLAQGEGVVVVNSAQRSLGEAPLIEQVALSFDAAPLLEAQKFLIEQLLLVSSISPNAVGYSEGGALSGTAMRLRMALTLNEVAALAQNFTEGLQEAVELLALLDSTVLGNSWTATSPISVEIQDGLPTDLLEQAQIISVLDSAGALSDKDKQQLLHPELTDAQLDEKVAQVQADTDRAAAASFTGLLGPIQQ